MTDKIKTLFDLKDAGASFEEYIQAIDDKLDINKEVDLNNPTMQVESIVYLRLLNIAKLAMRQLLYWKYFIDNFEQCDERIKEKYNALSWIIPTAIIYADEKYNHPYNVGTENIFERKDFAPIAQTVEPASAECGGSIPPGCKLDEETLK